MPQLYADSIRGDKRSVIAASGALIAYSGEKTGRSPMDKRVVKLPDSADDVWWGPITIAFTDEYDLQLYLKRSKWARPMFGDSAYHYDRLLRLRGL